MSAFIVEKKTIDRIVTYISSLDQRIVGIYYPSLKLITNDDGTRLGQQLWNMNVEAVNQRYNEKNPIQIYRFSYLPCKDIQVFKSMECFLYQCNEGDVPERELYKDLKNLKRDLACKIIQSLPEWQQAEWG